MTASATWKTAGFAMVAALLLAALSTFAPARAQTDGNAEVEAAIAALITAWNANDADGVSAAFTDDGLLSFAAGLGAPAGLTADEVREILPEVVGDPPIEVQQVRDVTEEGDTVTAIIELNAGGSLSNDRLTFVEVDGSWLIDLYESNAEPVEVPSGYETLDVDMFEYGYEFDPSGLAPGDSIAIQGQNIGEQAHEIVFFKADEDLDLEEALMSDGEPEGIEFLGFASAGPGQATSALLVDSLDAGRYVMVCFFPVEGDPEETPHFARGMVAEFFLASDDDSDDDDDDDPAPPDTGTGLQADGSGNAALAGIGVALVALTAGGAVVARKVIVRQ